MNYRLQFTVPTKPGILCLRGKSKIWVVSCKQNQILELKTIECVREWTEETEREREKYKYKWKMSLSFLLSFPHSHSISPTLKRTHIPRKRPCLNLTSPLTDQWNYFNRTNYQVNYLLAFAFAGIKKYGRRCWWSCCKTDYVAGTEIECVPAGMH